MEAVVLFRFSTFVALILTASESTHANWEYAKYGMTAEEIVAASEGNARRLKADEIEGKRTEAWTAIAAGAHSTGPFDFDVTFYSKPNGSRLHAVRLSLKPDSDKVQRTEIDDLRNALTSIYGSLVDSTVEPKEAFAVRTWSWQSDADNIKLVYMDGMAGIAWIDYTQRLEGLAL